MNLSCCMGQKIRTVPVVFTWDGSVMKYHKKYIQNLGIIIDFRKDRIENEIMVENLLKGLGSCVIRNNWRNQ